MATALLAQSRGSVQPDISRLGDTKTIVIRVSTLAPKDLVSFDECPSWQRAGRPRKVPKGEGRRCICGRAVGAVF